ncbi:MAG: hypothetical protein NWF08_07000 [Candidatus Bathyarchaeota archaeon]|nr:hypothetical protein [Candidatus Bathyarchaeota archaeon]
MSEKFKADLDTLMGKLREDLDNNTERKLVELKEKLIKLQLENVVKINHSVMELVCAKYLILAGYYVDIERFLDDLSCDIYAVKGFGSFIIEVETGFVPPENALDPLTYCKARIASKITRYSSRAEKFGIATPPHYIMQIPQALTKPPRYRTRLEIDEIKKLCDLYYTNPPVSLEEVKNARLHTIYIINIDKAETKETDPDDYIEKSKSWAY